MTAPGETVLGFTDPGDVQRTLPVGDGEEMRDAPPVVWRTGPPAPPSRTCWPWAEPGGGTTTLLRSVTLQALHHGGDVVVVDGGGTGEYACLTGREGVLAVETSLTGALAILEWACHETERRLTAAGHARQLGRAVPEDVRRPLWIVVDRPVGLSQLATGQGRTDPPRSCSRCRCGTGGSRASPWRSASSWTRPGGSPNRCGRPPGPGRCSAPPAPTGRRPPSARRPTPRQARSCRPAGATPGSARARCTGCRCRATPDPYDEEADEAQRGAVLALLPVRTAALPSGVEAVPWSGYDEELPAQAT
ncbi:hypothetical protein GCM10020000_68370 [Streptomyces olivoverticillatus]